MSNGTTLEATMRLEISQLQAQLAKANGEVARFREQLQTEGRRGAAAFDPIAKRIAGLNSLMSASARSAGTAGGRMNLGMMAMQFQDIAIQAQMGARWTTIIAQQGSQMLSAFGPAGMMVGGVVAIGGAFVTMGENAQNAFKAAKLDAEEFDSKMKVALLGSTQELAGTFDEVRKRIRAATDELSNLNSTFAVSANLADIFGGPSVEERINAAGAQLNAAGEAAAAIARQITETSAAELEIAELRARGEKEVADEKQRQLDLAKELARINALNMPRNVREQLAADATRKSELGAQTPKDLKKQTEDIAKLETKIADDKLKALDAQERYVALMKEQEAVYAGMAEKGALFFDQSMAGLEAWAEAKKKAGDMSGYLEVLKMIEKARELEKQMADAAEQVTAESDKKQKEIDDKRNQAETDKLKREAEVDRFAETYKKQQQAKQSLQEEALMLQAKAAGQTELVARMERELRIREKAQQIQEQTNVSSSQARMSAERMIMLEDQAAARAQRDAAGPDTGTGRKRGRIRGVQAVHLMGGYLSEFDALQQRDGTAATALGANSLSGRRNSSIPGHFMGPQIADRASAAAGQQDSREKQSSSGLDLGHKILATLSQGFFG